MLELPAALVRLEAADCAGAAAWRAPPAARRALAARRRARRASGLDVGALDASVRGAGGERSGGAMEVEATAAFASAEADELLGASWRVGDRARLALSATPAAPGGCGVGRAACWCAFEGAAGGRPLLCTLQGGGAELHALCPTTGESFCAPLGVQGAACAVAASPLGLLLLPAGPGRDLRLLVHPLDEPHVVEMGADGGNLGGAVLWASEEVPVVLCGGGVAGGAPRLCRLRREAGSRPTEARRYWLQAADADGPPEAASGASGGAVVATAAVGSCEAEFARGFVAHAADGAALVCVVYGGEMAAFVWDADATRPLRRLFARPARAAAPVVALRGDCHVARCGAACDGGGETRDVLVLEPSDATLLLCRGAEVVCRVSLPPALSRLGNVTDLVDAAGDGVTLLFGGDDGVASGAAARVALPFLPASPAARAILGIARGALPPHYGRALEEALLRALAKTDGSWCGGNGPWSREVRAEMRCVERAVLSTAGIGGRSGGGSDEEQGDACPRGENAWHALLGSQQHAACESTWAIRAFAPPSAACSEEQAWTAATVAPPPQVPPEALLLALHAVYEDCKLDTLRHSTLPPLARLLAALAAAVPGGGGAPYAARYALDQPREAAAGAAIGSATAAAAGGAAPLPQPFDAMQWLLVIVEGRMHTLPQLPAEVRDGGEGTAWLRDVVAFYARTFDAAAGTGTRAAGVAARANVPLPVLMVQRGFGLAELERLPAGVALPLQQSLARWRALPPTGWSPAVYVLLGRPDLAANAGSGAHAAAQKLPPNAKAHELPFTMRPHARDRPLRDLAAALEDGTASGTASEEGGGPSAARDDDDSGEIDGMAHLCAPGGGGAAAGDPSSTDQAGAVAHGSLGLRFRRDLRIVEVRRLLSSAVARAVRVDASPESSAPDQVALEQTRLLALAHRTAAAPLGRGALTLSTASIAPTESVPIPALVYDGRLPSRQNARITLDANAGAASGGAAASPAVAAVGASLQELSAWPHFHNGVAAGLCFAPWSAADESTNPVTRSWIVYNKPPEPSHSHAGLLMALGLTGQLSVLSPTDAFRYLSQEHDATAVGVLLGMGAARRGTMDAAVSKMLFLHIPARHPHSYPDLELSPLVQAAALVGAGLLYQGSAHRLMTEVLLGEIGRRPGADGGKGREGYALAAGLALGLVALGKGRSAAGIADLRVEERLLRYMVGGHDAGASAVGSNPKSSAGAGAGGQWGCGDEGSSAPNIDFGPGPADVYTPEPSTALGGGGGGAGGTGELDEGGLGSGQIMEGAMVNLDVSSPGATLALALIFLKVRHGGHSQNQISPHLTMACHTYLTLDLLSRYCPKDLALSLSSQVLTP